MQAIRRLYDYARTGPFEIKWGSGGKAGSFGLRHPASSPKTFLTVTSRGVLWFHFGWLTHSDAALRLRDLLYASIAEKTGFDIAKEQQHALVKVEDWPPKVESIVSALEMVAAELQRPA